MALAQSTDPWLGLVPVVEHTEGELAGMTTYRLYLYMQNEDDFLVSCSGDDMNPMELASTSTPAWFQHEVATTAFATDVRPMLQAWREARDLPVDPIEAHRHSGYAAAAAADRLQRKATGGGSYA